VQVGVALVEVVNQAPRGVQRYKQRFQKKQRLEPGLSLHDVALQVAFERQILKPVFHLIGYRLWV
jgi:hypothetical protein